MSLSVKEAPALLIEIERILVCKIRQHATRRAKTGQESLRHTQAISFVTISADGSVVASGSEDGLICLWDGHTGNHRASLEKHWGEILWLAFSGDGRRLSSISRASDEVVVWDTENARFLHRFQGHDDWVRCAISSPDPEGRLLASTSDDTFVRVWDLTLAHKPGEMEAHQPKMCLKGHTDYVFCASFSADGRYLASGGDDRSVRVWDLTPESNPSNVNDDQAPLSDGTTRHGLLCRNRSGRITGITFFPDNRQVISSSDDGAITIWDLLPTNEEGQQPIKQHINLKQASHISITPVPTQIGSSRKQAQVYSWSGYANRRR
ncbi:WD40-repeat-containing domain protein [Corynascus novoguineensis]|uniref:WD40-repeat-containing domain protein n=1 Tax=Corynascus novoguineensis TaxID=1126955 RepID=A0AAN7CM34_9PEZI|nr:WD40-repeat-containing domain protein [Corynascus novoguineensis]